MKTMHNKAAIGRSDVMSVLQVLSIPSTLRLPKSILVICGDSETGHDFATTIHFATIPLMDAHSIRGR